MSAYQQLFKRYEKKYTLTKAQYDHLIMAMADHMTIDGYGKHLIQNIYFDSQQFDLIRQSIEKPLYKEKLRLRCYGELKDHTPVYLEIKKKYKGIVYKRRIQVPYGPALAYLNGSIDFQSVIPYLDTETLSESIQVLKEIDWMIKRHQLEAQVYISYEREAYKCVEDADFRITFDSQLSFRKKTLAFSSDRRILSENQAITETPVWLMEVKTSGNMPLWFVQLLSQLDIYPASFSKYGECYKHHLSPVFINQLAVSRPMLLRNFEQTSLVKGGHIYA